MFMTRVLCVSDLGADPLKGAEPSGPVKHRDCGQAALGSPQGALVAGEGGLVRQSRRDALSQLAER